MFDFKNASAEALKAEYNRIARETGDDQFFTRKELNHLPEVLADGEQVLAFSSGLMDNNTWLIALTDRRLVFLDKGLLYGLRQVSIDLDKVNAIGGSTGMLLGSIDVEDGARTRTIANVPKRTVMAFTNKARDAMERRKRPAPAPAAAAPADDIISRLERLQALREKGLLSEDEVATQKAKILA